MQMQIHFARATLWGSDFARVESLSCGRSANLQFTRATLDGLRAGRIGLVCTWSKFWLNPLRNLCGSDCSRRAQFHFARATLRDFLRVRSVLPVREARFCSWRDLSKGSCTQTLCKVFSRDLAQSAHTSLGNYIVKTIMAPTMTYEHSDPLWLSPSSLTMAIHDP